MAANRSGLRGSDKRQDHLRDSRQGAYDPVGNNAVPDASRQTPHELAQPGADVRGEPIPAETLPVDDHALPEGLKRKRKGPLGKAEGRGDIPAHVPQPSQEDNRDR
jgi:hypothetical protein